MKTTQRDAGDSSRQGGRGRGFGGPGNPGTLLCVRRLVLPLALCLTATTATAHMIENHLLEHPQSPAAMECVTGEPTGIAPSGARADGRAPHGYDAWRFTNQCNRIITVVTCIEGASCNFYAREYGRKEVGEFQYYFDVDVVEPGETASISLCWRRDGKCYYHPPSAVRYAACFGGVGQPAVDNLLAATIEDGLIAALPNGDFACMLHGVEATPPPPVQGGDRE